MVPPPPLPLTPTLCLAGPGAIPAASRARFLYLRRSAASGPQSPGRARKSPQGASSVPCPEPLRRAVRAREARTRRPGPGQSWATESLHSLGSLLPGSVCTPFFLIGSTPSAEPNSGPGLMNPRSRPELRSRVRRSTSEAAQAPPSGPRLRAQVARVMPTTWAAARPRSAHTGRGCTAVLPLLSVAVCQSPSPPPWLPGQFSRSPTTHPLGSGWKGNQLPECRPRLLTQERRRWGPAARFFWSLPSDWDTSRFENHCCAATAEP